MADPKQPKQILDEVAELIPPEFKFAGFLVFDETVYSVHVDRDLNLDEAKTGEELNLMTRVSWLKIMGRILQKFGGFLNG